jgi:hypothetical protein
VLAHFTGKEIEPNSYVYCQFLQIYEVCIVVLDTKQKDHEGNPGFLLPQGLLYSAES